MHLGSYLGYLIGKECTGQDEECKIVVISKDTGFDHIIEFWKTEKDVKFPETRRFPENRYRQKQVKNRPVRKDRQVAEQTDQKQKNS